MSGKKSRRKGKEGEREVARLLRPIWPDLERSWQVRGGGEGKADVDCDDCPYHIEIKRQKRPSIPAAMRQAKDECGSRVPVAITRADRDEWMITMRLEDWIAEK